MGETVIGALIGAAATLAVREIVSGRVLVRLETEMREVVRRLGKIESWMDGKHAREES